MPWPSCSAWSSLSTSTASAWTADVTTPLRTGPERREVLHRRVRLLVAATITYNVVEGAAAVTGGTAAGSTALVGFGLDSLVEVVSAATVAWQFSARDPEARERVALRVIALSFFLLAAYVGVDAGRALLGAGEADPSVRASCWAPSAWR